MSPFLALFWPKGTLVKLNGEKRLLEIELQGQIRQKPRKSGAFFSATGGMLLFP
jgi:hypothetical protein